MRHTQNSPQNLTWLTSAFDQSECSFTTARSRGLSSWLQNSLTTIEPHHYESRTISLLHPRVLRELRDSPSTLLQCIYSSMMRFLQICYSRHVTTCSTLMDEHNEQFHCNIPLEEKKTIKSHSMTLDILRYKEILFVLRWTLKFPISRNHITSIRTFL